jgi:hypothetical protein
MYLKQLNYKAFRPVLCCEFLDLTSKIMVHIYEF